MSEEQAGFELHVEFVGLCMLVPDADGKTMHVLMPASHGHRHDGAHAGHDHHQHNGDEERKFKEQVHQEHIARIVVDTAHLRPGSTQPDEVYAAIALRRHFLHIDGTPTDIPTPLPESVAEHTDPVKPEVWDTDPTGLLRARVSLSAGKYETTQTARWHYRKPEPVSLTNQLGWKLRSSIPHLDLALEPLPGGKRASIRLYPLLAASGNTLRLEVHHVPRHELPPDSPRPPVPAPGTQARHFLGYYTLIQGPPGPVPRLVGVPASRPYTCLLSQANPQ